MITATPAFRLKKMVDAFSGPFLPLCEDDYASFFKAWVARIAVLLGK